MDTEPDLVQAYDEFWEDLFVEADLSGSPQQEAFFRLYARMAGEAGECTDLIYTPARKDGRGAYQIDGYALEKETEELYVAVSDFREGRDQSLNVSQIEALLQRAKNFLELSVSAEFITALEETSPAFEAAYPIYSNTKSIRRIRIIIFSNARLSTRRPPEHAAEIIDRPVVLSIFDFARYDAMKRSMGRTEPIEIDVTKLNGKPLPALEVQTGESGYSGYLTAIPGPLLSSIYSLYGARLLEQNVRTFLQAKTKVNRGIIETASTEPEMFFAYNNGITATASKIEVVRSSEGACGIKSISDLQIVNGGQTTASVLYAKDRSGADLARVLVPMKLSVIERERIDETVPKISRFANTQNKISEADFFSSHGFHVKMEQISRRLVAPAKPGFLSGSKWFYERARGQYKDQLAYGTPATRRKFEHEFPKDQVIDKTDLGKFELSWLCQPHVVSLGEQKCFVEFTGKIGKEWEKDESVFDEEWFRRMVAKAIVFRWTDRMVAASEWYKEDRGYKAQIVTYTLAWTVAWLKRARNSEISLERIWANQAISNELSSILEHVAREVARKIKDTPGNVKNVGEYCKQAACWAVVEKMPIRIGNMFPPDVRSIQASRPEPRNGEAIRIDTVSDELSGQERILNIRQIFNGSGTLSRDHVIVRLGELSGYSALDDASRKEMENTIRTAVRRGILESRGDQLGIQAHAITDFDKDFLKEQFLSSLGGRGWVDRQESTRNFARWLGYRRTGPWIDEAAKSIMNGLIRQGKLEGDGARIRRVA
ncbi:AIPR family protein [Bradyrhizobium quebecense]|uniref:AIPR family protein n=2 Tax=Bradyrhizobium quebecense TaxID=2748629 RepID=A0ABS3MT30_9BRAD|nr:AIPR family protein [Bradyrhizobium quebecense]UGY02462.1 AIPR family protein [Bradyrhizobium quebecense]